MTDGRKRYTKLFLKSLFQSYNRVKYDNKTKNQEKANKEQPF